MLAAARLPSLPLALALAALMGSTSCGARTTAPTATTSRERLPACVVPAQPDPLTERGKRAHRLIDELTRSYRAVTTTRASDGGAVSAEDLASGALAALVLENDTSAAEALLHRLAQRQITDRSDARGRFTSTEGGAHPLEADSRSELGAVTLPLAALLKKLHGCIRPGFRRDLDGTVALAIEALRRDAVRVQSGATRTWLQESISLALLGETQGDVAAAAQGQEQLDAWRKATSLHGLTEYAGGDSYADDLDALLLGDAYLEDAGAKTICHEGAQLVLRDLAAHWFPSHAAMAGPTSRSAGRDGGEVQRIAELAGWLDAPATSEVVPLRRVQTLLAVLDGAELPDDEARAVFSAPRVVTAAWEDPDRRELGRQTYTFLTPDIALGATSAAVPERAGEAPGQDRALDAELAAPDARPVTLTVHAGGVRLEPTLTAAQDRGALLVTVVAPAPTVASSAGAAPTEVVTELSLPMVESGELAVEGRRSGAQLGLGAVMGTRAGTGGIAVQLADASGCHGAPRIELRSDPAAGVAHLIIVHGDANRGSCRPRATFLVIAGHADSHAELAGLMESARTTVTERVQEPGEAAATSSSLAIRGASVRIDRGAFRGISLSFERRARVTGTGELTVTLLRRANGHPMDFGVLELDGKNISPFVH